MSNRHWTDEEIAEAYRYWAWESEDSFRATSEYLGIPERTVRNWAERDKWAQEKRKAQADLAEPAVGEAKVELKLGLSAVVKRLLADAIDPKAEHRDRLESQKMILALTLGQQYDLKSGSNFISLTDARQIHMTATGPEKLSPADLRKLSSKAIEANVSAVDSGKSKRNGPVRFG